MYQDDEDYRITCTIWRRHSADCKQRADGRDAMKCRCPIWGDGCVNSVRVLRQSLNTRNIRIARKRLAGQLEEYLERLESNSKPSDPSTQPARTALSGDPRPATVEPTPTATPALPSEMPPEEVSADDPCLLVNAKKAYIDSCETNGVGVSTIKKYKNTLNQLLHFTEHDEVSRKKKIRKVADFKVTDLDRFRASRKLAKTTSLKELETLRAFWAFCTARDLCNKNIAALIKGPKIENQNDVVPYTHDEMMAIIDACNKFGLHNYERKRARAAVLLLRHTALRISDVALLRRDRISLEKGRWRIFVRTTKNHELVYLLVPDELVEAINALPTPRGADKNCPYIFWNVKSQPKSQISQVSETLGAVFRKSGVANCHAHRFRHTLATDLVGICATFEEVADVLGNSPEIVRKHYAKWSKQRQDRLDNLVQTVHEDAWKRDT